ncbi:MAG TPA: hypothetical protein VFE57_02100 [Cyclobacteriaceae bacterium]|nr:hypothetical protein [Cyclobacteriaceae bacterium]
MSTTRKIAIGLGIAGGAALAAWLLTGDRGKKTKEFVAKKAQGFKESLKKEKQTADDSDVHYV